MTKRVIITGDDFGLALPVNEAIERAHRDGVLTTTSLLVGAQFAEDAVAVARRNPGLRVGLHIAVCEAKPLLAPSEIPDLVNARGELHQPVRALFTFLFLPRTKAQLEREIRAQFAAFSALGLAFDHVNGHNNMQLHPVVLPILLRVAKQYGVRAIRLPSEPLLASLRAARASGELPAERARRRRLPLWARLLQWCVMRPWGAYVKWRYRRAGFIVNDHLFGIYDCGGMDLDLLVGVLRNLPDGVSEIHCHPATRRCAQIDDTMPDYQHEAELAALLSPSVRETLTSHGIEPLRGYSDLSSDVQRRSQT